MHDASYIITYREANDPARRANLLAVLGWLAPLAPAETIIVEQDDAPTLGDLPPAPGRRVAFAYNPGAFNKGWGFNIGARLARQPILIFADADLIAPALPRAVARCRDAAPVVRGFSTVADLDPAASDRLRRAPSAPVDPAFAAGAADRRAQGEYPPVCGGLVVFDGDYLRLLGGWDERFLGWGGEDDAMSVKVARAGIAAEIMPDAPAFHLHHRRAQDAQDAAATYRTNLALLDQLRTLPEVELKRLCEVSWQLAGNRDMHRPARTVT